MNPEIQQRVQLERSVVGTIIATLRGLEKNEPSANDTSNTPLQRILIVTLIQELRSGHFKPAKLEVTESTTQGPMLKARAPRDQYPRPRLTILQTTQNKIIYAHTKALPGDEKTQQVAKTPLDKLSKEIHPKSYVLISPGQYQQEITGTQPEPNQMLPQLSPLSDKYNMSEFTKHWQELLQKLENMSESDDTNAKKRVIQSLLPLIVFQLTLQETTIIDYYERKHLTVHPDELSNLPKQYQPLQRAEFKMQIRIPLTPAQKANEKPTINENYLNAVTRLLQILTGQEPDTTKQIIHKIMAKISPQANTLFLPIY